MVQSLQRIRARHRPAEGREIAEMVGEALPHKRHDVARHGVRFEALALGGRKACGQGLAVFLVEIPLAALGLVALHQQPRLAAHLAIEELHAIGFSLVSPTGETAPRAEEAVVLADLQWETKLRGPFAHHLRHPPFAGLRGHEGVRLMRGDGAGEFAGEETRIGGVVKPHIMHADAFAFQFLGEMAHGREDQDDLLLVVRGIGRLLRDLGHEHDVLRGVEAIERAQFARELIAEHQTQIFHH